MEENVNLISLVCLESCCLYITISEADPAIGAGHSGERLGIYTY